MAKKITISWDEVNSPKVDRKLREASAFGDDAEQAQPESSGGLSQLIYSTLVYSTLFGVLGGVLAGVAGEIFQSFRPAVIDEYEDYAFLQYQLVQQHNNGEISEEEFDQRSAELQQQFASNALVAIESDPELSDIEKFSQIDAIQEQYGGRELLITAFWFTSVGMLLGFCLSIADQAMGRNLFGIMTNGSVALALALVGAVFGGCFASIIYGILGGGEGGNFVMQVFARAVGWGLFGGFLSIAPGVVLKNWKRLLIGLAGGLIGGTLGGALFDPISLLTGSVVLSRLVAILAIGALTGLGVGVLENVAKTGWLRVVHGLIAGKQFILYKDTTYIGSSPQCEIYLFRDASISPRHAALHKRGGGHEIEDLGSTSSTYVNGSPVTRTRLKRGDQIQIGSTVLRFQERTQN